MADVQSNADEIVVSAVQDLSVEAAASLRSALAPLMKPEIQKITVDLSGVSKIDSSGLALLIAMANTVSGQGGVLVLDKANPELVDLFKVTRLDQKMAVTAA